MSTPKPLTKGEFQEVAKMIAFRCPDGTVSALLATIDAGGFAPEPLSERALLSWLWANRVVPRHMELEREFNLGDLGRALWKLRLEGRQPSLYTVNSDWVVEDNITYRCKDLGVAARTVAALAYATVHPDAVIDHLLEPEEVEY